MPEPTRSLEPRAGEPCPAEPNRAPSRLAWLLPPLLALLAIGAQYAFDVPKAEMLEREEDKPKPKPRATKKKTKWKPRDPAYIRKLRKAWSGTPLREEPVNQEFRRRHHSVLRAVVRLARRKVVPKGQPVSLQVRPSCHTIRCELQVCSTKEIVDLIAEQLPEVRRVRGKLWHEFDEVEATRGPAEGSASPTKCRRWIVSFVIDNTNKRKLRLD